MYDLVYGNWLEFGVCGKVSRFLILSAFPCLPHLDVFPPTQVDTLINGVLLNNICQFWNSSACVAVHLSYVLPFSSELNGRVEHVLLGHMADNFA